MRAEDNQRFDDDYHARGGPLGVSDPAAPLPICEAWFEAAGALGIPFNPDFNGARQEGVGHYQLTQRNARRSSAATAYLGPIRGRRNLDVRTDARVLRILVERGRATGVEVAARGGIETLRADREVIVSCGAIGSPVLLMHSGIGPAEHLSRTGVPVVHDLPGVGSNLHDHLNLFTISECTGDHTYDAYAKVHKAAWAGLRYALFRNGPAASSLFETGGFWRVGTDAGRPDVQFHLGLGSGIEAGVVKLARCRGDAELGVPAPGVAGHGSARIAGPGRRAADRSELLGRAERPRDGVPGPETRPRDHAPGAAETLRGPRGAAGAGGRRRRNALRLRVRERQDRPPSGRHMPHGDGRHGRGEPGPEGAWHRGVARRRLLGHAAATVVQHQRTDDHDWREGIGPDPRTRAAAACRLRGQRAAVRRRRVARIRTGDKRRDSIHRPERRYTSRRCAARTTSTTSVSFSNSYSTR